ncbi:uncharacterized protein LOC141719815 [Apium graveolens]|uniref:uncharacterized protein LOC141719815 n=1 Tax=Apium graveolens TaxID=4045 RepID=UPI003D79BCCB
MLYYTIKNLLEQVESLGEAGKVDEAEALMRKVMDLLNAEKTAVTLQPQNDKVLMLAREKKMALCETCGSFLVANDVIERTQSHVTRKQHIGYKMVRDFLPEFKEAKEKAREQERLAREKEAEERRKHREKEVESRCRRSVSGDRDRDRNRDRDRERDRYRDQDHERSRERNGRGSREGGEGWIQSTAVVEMEERGVEIDTESVIGACHVPPVGVVAEGHLEIMSSYITELCCLMMSGQ